MSPCHLRNRPAPKSTHCAKCRQPFTRLGEAKIGLVRGAFLLVCADKNACRQRWQARRHLARWLDDEAA